MNSTTFRDATDVPISAFVSISAQDIRTRFRNHSDVFHSSYSALETHHRVLWSRYQELIDHSIKETAQRRLRVYLALKHSLRREVVKRFHHLTARQLVLSPSRQLKKQLEDELWLADVHACKTLHAVSHSLHCDGSYDQRLHGATDSESAKVLKEDLESLHGAFLAIVRENDVMYWIAVRTLLAAIEREPGYLYNVSVDLLAAAQRAPVFLPAFKSAVDHFIQEHPIP